MRQNPSYLYRGASQLIRFKDVFRKSRLWFVPCVCYQSQIQVKFFEVSFGLETRALLHQQLRGLPVSPEMNV